VVTSLWQVDDEASASWMTFFYAAFAQGNDLARAVGRASQQMLEQRKRAAKTPTPIAGWPI
jgi:CHAT domain-containing protein